MIAPDWLREDRLPHIYCTGCGNGTVINCTLAAVEEMGWKRDETVFVSGIGCSSRAPGYILTDSLHTTHGRALAFATGVKMARPEFNVVVFTGDGDLAAIGGNHFIHACRRNVDMTVVCMNNHIYGMTGGQGSPTTPPGAISTTTPYGMSEPAFDLAELAVAAGANYVARWTSYHVKELTKAITAGMRTPGFAFIEARTQCPTNYGRHNKLRTVPAMIEHIRSHAMLIEKRDRLVREGRPVPEDIFTIGELVRRNRPAMGVRR
ncbi:MAG: 2-oxoglutarate synthase subunit KorB [Euryarchaeota archaeon ADurb.Bin009]|jgi:2-oxoglutarate ferredoxin oxidoreductase subunit beta|uniref:thiamine pyrophosphate-dependent enzyme n=1 Tax=Methanoculleus sp. TaxID=90427 RepID=UPI0009C4B26B|nr:thiamine pyrophosphate-dependent enzyme [Methanoculleus sp.]OQC69130.1 MAG: 2-oxoglutarate synthase subunit KorB [Euryarchaeota archaeon ADurb.Bin009]MBP7144584.1 2-oxoacid:ferredoxin oxidoreductase subunit beta [Methanoculleus sp.]HNT07252.1 thiamine pyrophosphate-dependent enzyme [Methanoculleus sp.]HNV37935.1 thiamine pyrophosphate-dependent enzyme [Methanoculleus sp.]HOC84741.1 thiamine pyrophosphate-dependent enzyme [Methanoculleus sp.]